MRYLIFTNTPAHVHLYKHVVTELRNKGHDVLVLTRDYGPTVELAQAADLPFQIYGQCDTSKSSLLRSLPAQFARIAYETLQFSPDVIFGMGAYAAYAGFISRAQTILVLDSETTMLDTTVSRQVSRATLTPDSFRRELGTDHYTFPGFKECAYLHPDVFETDQSIRTDLGVGEDQYILVRLNAFGSHHDVAESGFSQKERIRMIQTLAEYATVFVSDEGDTLDVSELPAQPYDLHPARLHDALAEASLLVADTQTMVTEAALLGTPAIRSNSFVGEGDMGNFVELEERGLVDNLRSFEDVLKRATAILEDGEPKQRERERQRLWEEKVNLTELLVTVAENPENVASIVSNTDANSHVFTGQALSS